MKSSTGPWNSTDRYVSARRIRVLGPVEVRVEGQPVLGGPKQRALFGLLAAAVPNMVTADKLIDRLWGEASSS